jgi:glutamyl-tRNA reductase
VRKKVRDIIEHLLSVALSVDSLVFGESQILGQFKRAYEASLENGHVRGRLSPLLNAIIREAKAIRSRVGLTQVHTSVATVAGQMAVGPSVQSVLFVGAGETNQTFAQYLKKRLPQVQLFWCTRSHQRAGTAVKNCGGHQIPWSALTQTELLPQADLLCVATHSPDILVDGKVLEAVKPQQVVDLSVPANASSKDAERFGIRYIGIDELNEHLHHHKSKSEQLMSQLNDEIRQSTQIVLNEWNNRKAGGFISEIHTASESILEIELESLNQRLGSLPEGERKLVQDWSKRLIKKINHLHFETLKRVLSTESQEDSQSGSATSDDQPHG